jgi:hypothetical protein
MVFCEFIEELFLLDEFERFMFDLEFIECFML